jgi:hypothetical protein
MKIDKLVLGIIIILFAALLIGDAILTTNNPANQILSPNDVKGVVGMVLLVLAGFYFYKATK